MNKYHPISCSLYDHLEIFAMRQQEVEIVMHSGASVSGVIQTIEARKGLGEFLILPSGREIRLDKLARVNDILFGESC